MLVHTSHLTLKADYVATKIEAFISNLTAKVLNNDGDLLNIFNVCLSEIKNRSKTSYLKNILI